MLRPKSPQESFFGSYLYDKIVPAEYRSGEVRAESDVDEYRWFRAEEIDGLDTPEELK